MYAPDATLLFVCLTDSATGRQLKSKARAKKSFKGELSDPITSSKASDRQLPKVLSKVDDKMHVTAKQIPYLLSSDENSFEVPISKQSRPSIASPEPSVSESEYSSTGEDYLHKKKPVRKSPRKPNPQQQNVKAISATSKDSVINPTRPSEAKAPRSARKNKRVRITVPRQRTKTKLPVDSTGEWEREDKGTEDKRVHVTVPRQRTKTKLPVDSTGEWEREDEGTENNEWTPSQVSLLKR